MTSEEEQEAKATERGCAIDAAGAVIASIILGEAPTDPGTYEGDDAKPVNKQFIPNKWCIRQCERCEMSHPGEWAKPLTLPDFSKRVYNIPR
jgi:hypothetical protein